MSQPNNATKPAALGRGLDHLMGPQVQKGVGTNENQARVTPNSQNLSAQGLSKNPNDFRVKVTALRPGKGQPRRYFDPDAHKELIESIAQKGVLQPILVRPIPNSTGSYEIIAGERRWRAAQEAGHSEVPVIIKPMSDQEAMEIGLIENIQRQDLNPIEEAQGYKRLIDQFGYNHEKLSRVISKSRSYITNMMRLLSLPQTIQQLVLNGKLTAGHARAIINSPFAADIAERVVNNGLSVRETEALVREFETKKNPFEKNVLKQNNIGQGQNDEGRTDQKIIEGHLQELLGCPVKIQIGKSAGEIILKFKTLKDLDDIIGRIIGMNQ